MAGKLNRVSHCAQGDGGTASSPYPGPIRRRNLLLLGAALLLHPEIASADDHLRHPFGNMAFELSTTRGHAEVAAEAVAPHPPGCKKGNVVASAGESRSLLIRELGPRETPVELPLPDTSASLFHPTEIGFDNQLERLVDGRLLLLWTGYTNREITPHPDWWDTWGNPGGFHDGGNPPERNGQRHALLLWRSRCGSGDWDQATAIDAGTVLTRDSSGTPQAGWCAQLEPGAGGFDRHELYPDPWSDDIAGFPDNQRIYVSTRCLRRDDDQMAVFTSTDTGRSWTSPALRLPAWSPVVMTSTPEGRLFMAQCRGAVPLLYWSDDHGATVEQPIGSDGYPEGIDIRFRDATGAIDCNGLGNDRLTGVGFLKLHSQSIARITDASVLFTYPAIAGGRQIYPIVAVTPSAAGADVLPVMTLTAAAPGGSVLLPSFIQDDRRTNVTGFRTAFLYWLETDGPADAPNVHVIAKYVVVNGPPSDRNSWTSPAALSDPAGWVGGGPSVFLGDYMNGGFFLYKKALKFVPAWAENGQIFARIITVKPSRSRDLTEQPHESDGEPFPKAKPNAATQKNTAHPEEAASHDIGPVRRGGETPTGKPTRRGANQ